MATSKQMENKQDKRMRYVCMTLNNYTEDEYSSIVARKDEVSYLVVGKEVGDSGTPHLQMYVEFKANNGKTMSAIKKFFKTDRLHIEERKGTQEQASEYCKKEDDFVEFGELSQQGQRTDWKMALEMLQSGMSVTDVITVQPQLMPCIKALERMRQITKCDPIERDVNVIVAYGDAGAGKSRFFWEMDDNLFSKPNGDWWDGYMGEDSVLLDDFYGGIMYAEFLKVLDRYKLRVPVKGGFVGARWKNVFITSNEAPSKWYKHGMTPALKRRISKCYKLVTNGDMTHIYEDDLDGNLQYVRTIKSKTGESVDVPSPVVEAGNEPIPVNVLDSVEVEVEEVEVPSDMVPFATECMTDAIDSAIKRVSARNKKILIPKRVVPKIVSGGYEYAPVVTDAHIGYTKRLRMSSAEKSE